MTEPGEGMSADLARLQKELTDQRSRLDAMQAKIARFLRDRAETLQGHQALDKKARDKAANGGKPAKAAAPVPRPFHPRNPHPHQP